MPRLPFKLTLPGRPDLRAGSGTDLEGAILAARFFLQLEDENLAVIDNRDSGYRWFVRRGHPRVDGDARRAARRTCIRRAHVRGGGSPGASSGAAEIDDRRRAQLVEQGRSKLRIAYAPILGGLES